MIECCRTSGGVDQVIVFQGRAACHVGRVKGDDSRGAEAGNAKKCADRTEYCST